jgi:hypothetical protein
VNEITATMPNLALSGPKLKTELETNQFCRLLIEVAARKRKRTKNV